MTKKECFYIDRIAKRLNENMVRLIEVMSSVGCGDGLYEAVMSLADNIEDIQMISRAKKYADSASYCHKVLETKHGQDMSRRHWTVGAERHRLVSY